MCICWIGGVNLQTEISDEVALTGHFIGNTCTFTRLSNQPITGQQHDADTDLWVMFTLEDVRIGVVRDHTSLYSAY